MLVRLRRHPDAAFSKTEIYEALEERGAKRAIRISANENPERDVAKLCLKCRLDERNIRGPKSLSANVSFYDQTCVTQKA